MSRCLVAFAVALLATGSSFSPAAGAERYVSAKGDDTANACSSAALPCRTIEHAVSQALDGDTIKITAGKFRDTVVLRDDDTLSFEGGFSADFAGQHPAAKRTVWKPRRGADGCLLIQDPLTPTAAPVDFHVQISAIDFRGARNNSHALQISLRQTDAVGSVAIVDSTISKNRSLYGAILASTDAFAQLDVTIDRCTVTRNRGGDVAGISVRASEGGTVRLRLQNSIVARNRTSLRGAYNTQTAGIRMYPWDWGTIEAEIYSSTITDNRSKGQQAGVFANGGSGPDFVSLDVRNSIISGNRAARSNERHDLADADDGNALTSVTATISHSNLGAWGIANGPVTDLGGNVSVDPLLDKRYRLVPGSPMIDAGTNLEAPLVDIDGDPRPLDGDNDSVDTTDMGADEYVP